MSRCPIVGRSPVITLLALLGCLWIGGTARGAEEAATDEAADGWQSLFDGKTLDGWEVLEKAKTSFAQHGKVYVDDGHLRLNKGEPATGIRLKQDFPTSGYELSLEAMRVEGQDFFCGLTFPVGDSPCTLIVGGWGGGVVGLSNVDDQSAVENQTTHFQKFENGKWYTVRLRVADAHIGVWIGDEQVIDLPTESKKFSVWWEQEPVRPLGIASWYTSSALRNIRWRKLEQAADDAGEWTKMFDGESLEGWKQSEFGTAADVEVQDKAIKIGFTDGCNGVTWTKDFPQSDYELTLEAMRVDGNDFFCGLTFPVGDSPCSLIVGGWGGAVVGLSSIDGKDAARNETRKVMGFERQRWYRIRLTVTKDRIVAAIDGETVVDFATAGRELSIRPEVAKSKPLGICSWCTTAALRDIRWKKITRE
ncbi:MAG: DUF1080 domain-containing protein [Pirellulales bacterium]